MAANVINVQTVVNGLTRCRNAADVILTDMADSLHDLNYIPDNPRINLSELQPLLAEHGYSDIPVDGAFSAPNQVEQIAGVSFKYMTRTDDPAHHFIGVVVADTSITFQWSNDGYHWANLSGAKITGTFLEAVAVKGGILIRVNDADTKKVYQLVNGKVSEAADYDASKKCFDTYFSLGRVISDEETILNVLGCKLDNNEYIIKAKPDVSITIESTLNDTVTTIKDVKGMAKASLLVCKDALILAADNTYRVRYDVTNGDAPAYILTTLDNYSVPYGFGYSYGDSVFRYNSSSGEMHLVGLTNTISAEFEGALCNTDGKWCLAKTYDDDFIALAPDGKLYHFFNATSTRMPIRSTLVRGPKDHSHFPDIGRSWFTYHPADMDFTNAGLYWPIENNKVVYVCSTEDNTFFNVAVTTSDADRCVCSLEKYEVADGINLARSTPYYIADGLCICDYVNEALYTIDPVAKTLTASLDSTLKPSEAALRYFTTAPSNYRYRALRGAPTNILIVERKINTATHSAIVHLFNSPDNKMSTLVDKGTITISNSADIDVYWKSADIFVVYSTISSAHKEYKFSNTVSGSAVAESYTLEEFTAASTGIATPTDAVLKEDDAAITSLTVPVGAAADAPKSDAAIYTSNGVYVKGNDGEYHQSDSAVTHATQGCVIKDTTEESTVLVNWDDIAGAVHYSGGKSAIPEIVRGSFRLNALNVVEGVLNFPVCIPEGITWNEIIFDMDSIDTGKSFRALIQNSEIALPITKLTPKKSGANGYLLINSSADDTAALQCEDITASLTKQDAADYYIAAFTPETATDLVTNIAAEDYSGKYVTYYVLGTRNDIPGYYSELK